MVKPTMTRRGVLGGAALIAATAATAGAAGLVGGSDGSPAGASRTAPGFPAIRRDTFERHVGGRFDVRGGSTRTTITLASVTPLAMSGLPRNKVRSIRTSGEQYSLEFSGTKHSAFDQGTYVLSTSGLEPLELLLVPIGPSVGIQNYQAIIVSV